MDGLDKYLDDETQFSTTALDEAKIESFKSSYESLCTDKQPTRFCLEICPDELCLYRYNLSEALKDERLDKRFIELTRTSLSSDQDPFDLWKKLASVCKEAAEEIVLLGGDEETIRKISLCFALQKFRTAKPAYSRSYQDLVLRCLLNLYKSPYIFEESPYSSIETADVEAPMDDDTD